MGSIAAPNKEERERKRKKRPIVAINIFLVMVYFENLNTYSHMPLRWFELLTSCYQEERGIH